MRSDASPDLFDLLARLHGHRCPMSILGARLGLAAVEALAPPPDRKRRGRYLHRTCALDGVQVTTGCTLGNGNLEVVPQGRHRLELGLEGEPLRVAAELTEEALARGRAWLEAGRDEAILRALERCAPDEILRVERIG
ncbi:formylmethanofuran dehydrogenase subunit E family protein [Deferrisoma palaeochoriense]